MGKTTMLVKLMEGTERSYVLLDDLSEREQHRPPGGCVNRVRVDLSRIPWGAGVEFFKERFVFNPEKVHYYWLMNPDIVRTQMRKMRRFEEKYKTGRVDLIGGASPG